MDQRSDPERMEPTWRIKTARSARTYRVSATYLPEKNTADRPVVTREARTWKLHVSAAIRRVHLHFGSSLLEVPLTCSADIATCGGAESRDAAPS
jgi:hypothetical protein